MPIDSPSTHDELILTGHVIDPQKTLFSRNVPVTVLASDDGVEFKIRHKTSSRKVFPYERLRHISTRKFLWKKTVIIQPDKGVETIRCSDSSEKISDFCKLIDKRIASARPKPFAARFNLTRLEVPLDQQFRPPEQAVEGFDFAIDSLFDPAKVAGNIFDKLDQEISVSISDTQRISPRASTATISIKDKIERPQYEFFEKKSDRKPNLYVTKNHIKKFSLGLSVIVLGVAAAWQLGEFPSLEPSRSISTKGPEKPLEPRFPLEQHDKNTPPRAMAQLVEIAQHNEKYRSLVGLLAQERIATGMSIKEMSALIGWDESKIEDMESNFYRATAMEIIDYSLAVEKDIHDIMDYLK